MPTRHKPDRENAKAIAPKTTLIAVSGMSPAILTETLWALSGETPPVVPDDVIVITTAKGRADIESLLLTKQTTWSNQSVWETLRDDIFVRTKQPKKSAKLQLSLRVIELSDPDTGIRIPAEDLRNREHNEEAANFILNTIAPIADAEDQHIIASIAGGRKTMGALLYAAMSLLGKETDRITHVLVIDPFDTVRGFFYPEQPAQDLEARSFGQPAISIRAQDADIQLADIPFVPLRNKFDELNERRSFAGLVDAYSKAERKDLKGKPHVGLDEEKGILTVEGRPIKLTGRDLLIVAFLYRQAAAGEVHFHNKDEAENAIAKFNSEWKKHHPFHQAAAKLSANGVTVDDIPKVLSPLRKKLTAAGLSDTIPYLAPKHGRIGFDIILD